MNGLSVYSSSSLTETLNTVTSNVNGDSWKEKLNKGCTLEIRKPMPLKGKLDVKHWNDKFGEH